MMKIGTACAIFDNIEDEEFTVMEKGEAIDMVLKMPTHNSFKKDTMLKVIAWLWDQVFEWEDEEETRETEKEKIPTVPMKWIPFTRRPPTEEEKEENPEFCYYLDGRLPDDGEEVLVSNGRSVWVDTFSYDGDGVGFECCGAIEEDMAWMPMPKPHKGEQEGE